MEQIGLKRAFESGGRDLTESEYQDLQTFRKMFTERNKSLGVIGRSKIRERAAQNRNYGITEHDAAAWLVLLYADTDRYERILEGDYAIIPFARYWSAGVLDDELIFECLECQIPVSEAIELFRQRNNIDTDDDFMYADTA